jgi:glycosyltransferase involved in cell wall biosynthesis
LRRAAVLAYPSLYEGFGFPPLQAMAAGVPVVATAAGSVPEVVGDGALLVDPADADALAGALSRVLAGGAEVEELIVRGRRRASEFTWEECAAGLVSLYRAAVHFRGGRAGRHAAGGTL